MTGLHPFLDAFIAARLIADFFFVGVLVSGIYALSKDKIPLYLALSLVIAFTPLKVAQYFLDLRILNFLVTGISALFFLQMLIMIVSHILMEIEINADLMIIGAACVYFLLGAGMGIRI